MDHAKYRTLMAEALDRAQREGKPPRAAWLCQAIRSKDPEFRLSTLGYVSFTEFAKDLGGFLIGHDGIDVVVARPGDPRPADARPDTPLARERVHPDIWQALTRPRTDGKAVFVDRRKLDEGAVQLVVEGEQPGGDSALVRLPDASWEIQRDWLLEWAASAGVSNLPEGAGAAEGVQGALGRIRREGLGAKCQSARVEWTKSRLRTWATEHGLSWGPPLVLRDRQPRRGTKASETASLRALVMELVKHMDEESLRELRAPVGLTYDILQKLTKS